MGLNIAEVLVVISESEGPISKADIAEKLGIVKAIYPEGKPDDWTFTPGWLQLGDYLDKLRLAKSPLIANAIVPAASSERESLDRVYVYYLEAKKGDLEDKGILAKRGKILLGLVPGKYRPVV